MTAPPHHKTIAADRVMLLRETETLVMAKQSRAHLSVEDIASLISQEVVDLFLSRIPSDLLSLSDRRTWLAARLAGNGGIVWHGKVDGEAGSTIAAFEIDTDTMAHAVALALECNGAISAAALAA